MKEERSTLYFLLFLGEILVAFTLFDNGSLGGRALVDESRFYYPSIVHFYNGLSISDYPAAIAPAYFYLMSLLGDDLFILKVANILLNLLFLFVIIRMYNSRSLGSLWLIVPICTSLYFVTSTLWLSPDNASFFASLVALYCYYQYRHKEQNSFQLLILLSISLTLAVWMRQTNLYLVGAIFLTDVFVYQKNHRLPQLIAAVTLPLLTLAYLFYVWQGLTPPSFAIHRAASLNLAAISHFFSLFFFYGVWFLGRPAWAFFKQNTDVLWKFSAVALIFSLIFANTQSSIDSQRITGGIVTFARLAPDILGYNLFEFFTCILGCLLFLFAIQNITRFDRYLIIFTSLTFFVSLTANFVIYERYYSMFVYLLLLHLVYIKHIKVSYALLPLIGFNSLVTVYKIGLI